MTNPFTSESFQEEMKPKLSMAFKALEYENIESSIVKVCAEMSDKLGTKTYEAICTIPEATPEPEPEEEPTGDVQDGNEMRTKVKAEALDYLQRTILHFALYHHIIYLIANVDNDGVTVTKSEDKTTIYKYQQDQLEEHLIADAWFWLNRLIKLLNENPDVFPDWAESAEHDALAELPVTIADFERFVGVSDTTFLLYAGWIVREVHRECILSRQTNDDPLSDIQKQAICYDVMARACLRLAYHALPSPIRIDINNEMGKNHAAQADTTVREKVSAVFGEKAAAYWKTVDAELHKKQETASVEYGSARKLTEHDKFVY